jgi:hypothetical protein
MSYMCITPWTIDITHWATDIILWDSDVKQCSPPWGPVHQNKRMFWVPTHCLIFLICTESSFLFRTHNWLWAGAYFWRKKIKKENTLTWTAVPYPWWWISHPLKSLAWGQLPLRPLLFLHPPHRLPANRTFIYTQTTITSPLLSGTNRNIPKLANFLQTYW